MLLGKLPLLAVERERVAAFHVRLNGVPCAENRAVALMSRMYAMAADWEMVPDGTNPCRSVRKYPARGRERFLTDTEFHRLGEVLGEAPTEGGVSVHAVAAIRLSYVQNLLQKGFDHVAECCRGHGWRVDIRYRSAGHAQPPSGGLLHQLAFVLRQ